MSRSLVGDASVALKWVVTEPGIEEAVSLLDEMDSWRGGTSSATVVLRSYRSVENSLPAVSEVMVPASDRPASSRAPEPTSRPGRQLPANGSAVKQEQATP